MNVVSVKSSIYLKNFDANSPFTTGYLSLLISSLAPHGPWKIGLPERSYSSYYGMSVTGSMY